MTQELEPGKPKPKLPEGCLIILLGVGFFAVFIVSIGFAAKMRSESEAAQALFVFSAISLAASVVFGLWGVSLLVRTNDRER